MIKYIFWPKKRMITNIETKEVEAGEQLTTAIAKVGIDKDDTLARCESLLVTRSEKYLGRRLTYRDLSTELKYSSDPQIRDLLYAVAHDPTFFHRRGFYKRAEEGLALLYRHPLDSVVITGRSKEISPNIENEFDDLMRFIRNIDQIPSNIDLYEGKVLRLQGQKIGEHIDDNIAILVAAAKVGVRGHLIRRPWNRTITTAALQREDLSEMIDIHPSFYRAAKSIVQSGRYPKGRRVSTLLRDTCETAMTPMMPYCIRN